MVTQGKRRLTKENESHRPLTHSTAKSLIYRLRNSLNDASHRRRLRTTTSGSINPPKYVVRQAKRRSTISSTKSPSLSAQSIHLTVTFHAQQILTHEVESATKGPAPRKTVPITLPRELARPNYQEVSREAIVAIDAELANTDLEYIRDTLEEFGPGMLKVLSSVKANPTRDALPKELSIMVQDLTSGPLPTHMMAVYGAAPKAGTQSIGASARKVTLFPAHNLVFAAYCSKLPPFPSSSTLINEEPESNQVNTLKVPVRPLCLPSPETYPQLSSYLYTKRTDVLLNSLLPAPAPPILICHLWEGITANNLNEPESTGRPRRSNSAPLPSSYPNDDILALASDSPILASFSKRLGIVYTTSMLLQSIKAIHGLWQNVCALGVFDGELWEVLDLAWKILLIALAVSTNHPEVGKLVEQTATTTTAVVTRMPVKTAPESL